MDNKTWKDIPGYEGLYQACTDGEIRSLPRKTTRGGLMSFYSDKSNRHVVYQRPTMRLSKDGKTKLHHVCRLVAKTFIPNTENKPEVNHIDFNPCNNDVRNLEWTTRKENHTHSVIKGRMARGGGHGMAKLNEVQVSEIRSSQDKPKDIATRYGVCRQTIYRIKNFRNWK